MSDQYRNIGKEFNPSMQPQYSVPPPSFSSQTQSGNFERNEKWNYDLPSKNIGYNYNEEDGRNFKNRDEFGGNTNQSDYGDKNRGSNSRFGGGGGGPNKGSFNKGNSGAGYAPPATSSSDMITQEDTIFVSGMNPSITESEIHSHFGAIGIIKKDKKTMKPKIWLYKHKESGLSKGEATVTYDDINAAQSAISWFDGRDFNGSVIRVSLAQRQNNWSKPGSGRKPAFQGNRGSSSGQMSSAPPSDRFANRSYDRGGNDNDSSRDDRGGNRGGGSNQSRASSIQQRDGDWKCSECSNTNFAWRNECNRCKSPKSDGPGNDSSDRSNYKNSMDNNRNNNRSGGGGGGGGGFSRGGGSSAGGGHRRDGNGPMKSNNSALGSRSKPY